MIVYLAKKWDDGYMIILGIHETIAGADTACIENACDCKYFLRADELRYTITNLAELKRLLKDGGSKVGYIVEEMNVKKP